MRRTGRNRTWGRAIALLSVLVLACTACGGGTSMRLVKTEGTVGVQDRDGKDLEPRQKLKLYSGYGVRTARRSYAWIGLDEAKLAKLDASSEAEVQQKGKRLEVQMSAGKLFFNVSEPLADDESMEIRTSAMLIGIRGTCGWVEAVDGQYMDVYLLEGEVECGITDPVSGGSRTVAVSAGERATVDIGSAGDVQIAVEKFSENEISPFVLKELREDEALQDRVREASGLDISRLPFQAAPGDIAAQAGAELGRLAGAGANSLSGQIGSAARQKAGGALPASRNAVRVDAGAAAAAQKALVEGMLGGGQQGLLGALSPQWKEAGQEAGYLQVRMASEIHCYKPNIYLYGKEGTSLSLSFAEPALLTRTDPAYVGAWEVELGEDGLTVDGAEGYPFLFYESRTIPGIFQRERGFLLKTEDRAGQMREILEEYGLNGQEIRDFLEFWDQMLDREADYLMYPQDTEQVDAAMPITVEGAQLDNYFRLWFCFEEAPAGTATPERPVAVPASHEGTALVEWGGMLLP